MNDRVPAVDVGSKEILVLPDARRRRLGKLSRALDIVKDVLRHNIHAVTVGIFSQYDGERHDPDIMLCDILAEVAGTVCRNLNHISSSSVFYEKSDPSAARKFSQPVESHFMEIAHSGTTPMMLSQSNNA